VKFYRLFPIFLAFALFSGLIGYGVERFSDFTVETYVKSDSNPAKEIVGRGKVSEEIWQGENSNLVLAMAKTINNIKIYCEIANVIFQVLLCLVFSVIFKNREV
jgi:hypothetical protein